VEYTNHKMGRYYYGNINGKFWFGIQSSAPLDEYGGREIGCECFFRSCHCQCDDQEYSEDNTPLNDDYCQNCFKSLEEHKKAVADEYKEDHPDEEPDEEDLYLWEFGNMYNWEITRDEFKEHCEEHIERNKKWFHKYIKSMTFDKDGDYEYDFEYADDEEKLEKCDELGKLADLCFMKQVEAYFENEPEQEVCGWSAEY
jgi:hypothetical protein